MLNLSNALSIRTAFDILMFLKSVLYKWKKQMIEMNLTVGVAENSIGKSTRVQVVLSFSFNIYGYEHAGALHS